MTRSMTGFGQGSAEVRGVRFQAEARSVNHRFLDLKLRLPGRYQLLEKEIRALIRELVHRGRVEVGVSVVLEDRAPELALNETLVQSVLAAAGKLQDGYGLKGAVDVATVLRTPGILQEAAPETDPDAGQREGILQAVAAAVNALVEDRIREGQVLREEILGRLGKLEAFVDEVAARADRVPAEARERLEARLEKLTAGLEIDESRLAQESALLADRSDVTEEVVRLNSHIAQAAALLEEEGGEPVGKRLDFLLQEIHRETNTINSKSSDLEISRHALAMKTEGDKIREQIQNLE